MSRFVNRWIVAAVLLASAAAIWDATGAAGQEPGQIGGGAVGPVKESDAPANPPTSPFPRVSEDSPKTINNNEAPATGGLNRSQVLISSLTIFMLAVFVGFEVITKVPPTLHTPLMSGSNAISGITIIGAILVTGVAFSFSSVLGFIALVLAAINVVGGFLVTHRMLSMFNKR